MNNGKFDKKYQFVYEQFKDYHKSEGYNLDWIGEIYLPFWVCRQEIFVQTGVKADVFSKIVLQLVEQGIKNHSEICAFLGVAEDDFCLMQLDFLISHNFLEENRNENSQLFYEITHAGRDFLDNKKAPESIEATEVEYIINDLEYINEQKYESFYSDLTQQFISKESSIDSNPNKNFFGYRCTETHKLRDNQKNKKYPKNHIPHSDKPTLRKLQTSNFIEFFNKNSSEIFYDFGNKKIEAHQRSIKFYILHFLSEKEESVFEIRHCAESVNKFDKKRITLECTLSKKVEKYINQEPKFLKQMKNPADEIKKQ